MKTTIVYVLIEIFFKFVRIKCAAYIQAKIKVPIKESSKAEKPSKNPFLIDKKKMTGKSPLRTYSRMRSLPAHK